MLDSQLLSLFLHRFNTLLKCSRMELKKEIRILGRRFEVEPRAKESLKGITVGEKLSYRFYDGTYQGTPLLFVEPKKGNPSPRTCAITGKRLTEALGLPAGVYPCARTHLRATQTGRQRSLLCHVRGICPSARHHSIGEDKQQEDCRSIDPCGAIHTTLSPTGGQY